MAFAACSNTRLPAGVSQDTFDACRQNVFAFRTTLEVHHEDALPLNWPFATQTLQESKVAYKRWHESHPDELLAACALIHPNGLPKG